MNCRLIHFGFILKSAWALFGDFPTSATRTAEVNGFGGKTWRSSISPFLTVIIGVFLIPYFIFLFLVGIPLVLLEMAVGQFTSTGPFDMLENDSSTSR